MKTQKKTKTANGAGKKCDHPPTQETKNAILGEIEGARLLLTGNQKKTIGNNTSVK